MDYREVAVLSATALSLIGLALWVLVASLAVQGTPCHNPPHRVGQWPPLLIVAMCAGAFALGRLAGYWRDPAGRVAAGAGPSWSRRRVRVAVVVQSALAGFLLLVAILLAYETYSLAQPERLWPITYYVRCANEIATLPTAGGAAVICFLLGHWLWYPRRDLRD